LRVAAALTLILSTLAGSSSAASATHITTVRPITFPVAGESSYSADFLAPRSGGRQHKGTDIFGDKLQQVVAANDGTVVRISGGNSGLSGNWLVVRDAEGWEYSYFHLNNDSPDTDDGANPPEWIFAPGIVLNAQVTAGQALGYIGDSGNAENTPPHVHFGIKRPDRTSISPWPSLRAAQGLARGDRCTWSRNPARSPDPLSGSGQWATTATGVVTTHGNAPNLGDLSGIALNDPIVGMTTTRSGEGFWLVAADGGVFAFGDAEFYGSTGAIQLNKPIVGMAATATGLGYWLVASDGGIFAYGDAEFYGSTGDIVLNAPVAGMATTADGRGYWLVASDGGVFSFGDADFVGSLPGANVEAQIIGVAAPSGKSGYWLLNAEGGVYAFGDVMWHGSVQSAGFCDARTGSSIVATRTGAGYWIQSNDGRIWPFGDATTIDDAAPAGVLALTPSGGPPELESEPNPDAKS
jgi:Peptidase family M23